MVETIVDAGMGMFEVELAWDQDEDGSEEGTEAEEVATAEIEVGISDSEHGTVTVIVSSGTVQDASVQETVVTKVSQEVE